MTLRRTPPAAGRWLALLALLLVPTIALAQAGGIQGRVVAAESGEGLPGASVGLAGTTLGAAADADGYFRIEDVAAGRYTVVVTAIGYAGARREVEVAPGERAAASFELRASRYELDGLVVSATRTGTGVTSLVRFWLGPDGSDLLGKPAGGVSFGESLQPRASFAPGLLDRPIAVAIGRSVPGTFLECRHDHGIVEFDTFARSRIPVEMSNFAAQ